MTDEDTSGEKLGTLKVWFHLSTAWKDFSFESDPHNGCTRHGCGQGTDCMEKEPADVTENLIVQEIYAQLP